MKSTSAILDPADQGYEGRLDLPPQDLHAEQATLGGMLVEARATRLGLAAVVADDFYREAHGVIYTAIEAIETRQEPVDIVTVTGELRSRGKLDAAGGAAYLAALIRETPTAAHVVRYAQIVTEKAALRRLISTGADLQAIGYSNTPEVDEALNRAESLVADVRKRKERGAAVHGEDIASLVMREGGALLDEFADPKGVTGPRLGIRGIDEDILGGLPCPGLVVVRAETSYGKTALLCQCARTTAQYGIPVVYFDLETSRRFVLGKLVQQICGLDRHRARLRGASETELAGAATALDQLRKLPLHIEDPGRITFPELRGRIRDLHHEQRRGLYVIDFVQQISVGDRRSVWEALAEMTGDLQGLARDLQTTIAVGSQVSRTEFGIRTRGASELQHRSDVLVTIRKHLPRSERKELDARDEERVERESPAAVILIDKFRQGATGWRTAFWHPASQLFLDLREVAHWVLEVAKYKAYFKDTDWRTIQEGADEPPQWTGYDNGNAGA